MGTRRPSRFYPMAVNIRCHAWSLGWPTQNHACRDLFAPITLWRAQFCPVLWPACSARPSLLLSHTQASLGAISIPISQSNLTSTVRKRKHLFRTLFGHSGAAWRGDFSRHYRIITCDASNSSLCLSGCTSAHAFHHFQMTNWSDCAGYDLHWNRQWRATVTHVHCPWSQSRYGCSHVSLRSNKIGCESKASVCRQPRAESAMTLRLDSWLVNTPLAGGCRLSVIKDTMDFSQLFGTDQYTTSSPADMTQCWAGTTYTRRLVRSLSQCLNDASTVSPTATYQEVARHFHSASPTWTCVENVACTCPRVPETTFFPVRTLKEQHTTAHSSTLQQSGSEDSPLPAAHKWKDLTQSAGFPSFIWHAASTVGRRLMLTR